MATQAAQAGGVKPKVKVRSNATVVEIRVISRALNNTPGQLGALRHDAMWVRMSDGEQYTLERTGPKGGTNDFRSTRVQPRLQSIRVRYEAWPRDSGIVVDGFGSNVPSKVTMEQPHEFVGVNFMFYPVRPVPQVTWKSSGKEEIDPSSSEVPAFLREDVELTVWLEDTETSKVQSWSAPKTTSYPTCTMTISNLQAKAEEYVRTHPYNLDKFNCHELVRHLNDVLGLENKPVPDGDAFMYRIAGIKPSVSSTSYARDRYSTQNFLHRESDKDFVDRALSSFLHLDPHTGFNGPRQGIKPQDIIDFAESNIYFGPLPNHRVTFPVGSPLGSSLVYNPPGGFRYLPRSYMDPFGPLHTPRIPQSKLPSFLISRTASSSQATRTVTSPPRGSWGSYGPSGSPMTYEFGAPDVKLGVSVRESPSGLPVLSLALLPTTPLGWGIAAGALAIYLVATSRRSGGGDRDREEVKVEEYEYLYCCYLERPDWGFVILSMRKIKGHGDE